MAVEGEQLVLGGYPSHHFSYLWITADQLCFIAPYTTSYVASSLFISIDNSGPAMLYRPLYDQLCGPIIFHIHE